MGQDKWPLRHMMPFEKVDEHGEFHPGPAKISEVLPLVVKYILPGGIISSDGLLAYKNTLTNLGYQHTIVNHIGGEFVDAGNLMREMGKLEKREDVDGEEDIVDED